MIFQAPSFGLGFAFGFGTGFMTREMITVSRMMIRPMAKATVKSGMFLVDRSRESFAHLGEAFEDLVAEAKSELQAEEAKGNAKGKEVVAGGEQAVRETATRKKKANV